MIWLVWLKFTHCQKIILMHQRSRSDINQICNEPHLPVKCHEHKTHWENPALCLTVEWLYRPPRGVQSERGGDCRPLPVAVSPTRCSQGVLATTTNQTFSMCFCTQKISKICTHTFTRHVHLHNLLIRLRMTSLTKQNTIVLEWHKFFPTR